MHCRGAAWIWVTKMTDDTQLEDVFEALRRTRPAASAALFERIMEDAERISAARAPRVETPGRQRRGLFSALGGWPGLAGLAASALAGVWIGVAQPTGFDPLSVLPGSAGLEAELDGYADLTLED